MTKPFLNPAKLKAKAAPSGAGQEAVFEMAITGMEGREGDGEPSGDPSPRAPTHASLSWATFITKGDRFSFFLGEG